MKKDSKKNIKEVNKKQFVFLVVIVIFVIFVFGFIIFLFKKSDNEYELNSSIEDGKYLINCRKDENDDECLPISNSRYSTLHLKNNYSALDKKVDEINKETDRLYKSALESDTNKDDQCDSVKDLYKYRYLDETYYDTFEDDKYSTVAVRRSRYDACYSVYSNMEMEIYIYDIKKKKIVSQDEFIKSLNVSDKEIDDAINKDLNFFKERFDEIYTVDVESGKELYYDNYGDLKVSYRFAESGEIYSSTVRKSGVSHTSNLKD